MTISKIFHPNHANFLESTILSTDNATTVDTLFTSTELGITTQAMSTTVGTTSPTEDLAVRNDTQPEVTTLQTTSVPHDVSTTSHTSQTAAELTTSSVTSVTSLLSHTQTNAVSLNNTTRQASEDSQNTTEVGAMSTTDSEINETSSQRGSTDAAFNISNVRSNTGCETGSITQCFYQIVLRKILHGSKLVHVSHVHAVKIFNFCSCLNYWVRLNFSINSHRSVLVFPRGLGIGILVCAAVVLGAAILTKIVLLSLGREM